MIVMKCAKPWIRSFIFKLPEIIDLFVIIRSRSYSYICIINVLRIIYRTWANKSSKLFTISIFFMYSFLISNVQFIKLFCEHSSMEWDRINMLWFCNRHIWLSCVQVFTEFCVFWIRRNFFFYLTFVLLLFWRSFRILLSHHELLPFLGQNDI
jgi:hypothetical protein